MRTERLVSAGGVVYRVVDGKMQVVLCGRNEPEIWGLPKGTPNPGETLEETALREVQEETGLEVRILHKVTSIDYWFVGSHEDTRYHKTVHHYLMEPVGGSVGLHDREFDIVEWFDAEEACRKLTYGNEAKVVRRAMEMVGVAKEGGPDVGNE
ncbi:MAG: NUDIX hydrolase [Chloroflexi bacterium]|nr:NUDIX hydrolase [Chloroflexota bacterium]